MKGHAMVFHFFKLPSCHCIMKIFKLTTIALFAGLAFNANEENGKPDTAGIQGTTKAIYFNAGLQYMSNLTYAGRKDQSSIPVALPSFTLLSKHGLFGSAIHYFVA